jgi:hypothetical protein
MRQPYWRSMVLRVDTAIVAVALELAMTVPRNWAVVMCAFRSLATNWEFESVAEPGA